MNKDLNIYRIDITTDSKLPYIGNFQFFMDKKISKDKALKISTEAIEHYIEYLSKKDEHMINRDDFYDLIHRGFIKLGKIYDYNTISITTLDENVHKVRSLKKAVKEEETFQNNGLEKLDVYAIDGTPSKGYVFGRTERLGGNSEGYNFVFLENYSRALAHEIHIYKEEPSYSDEWNYETQRKRYSDTIATPENMFKMSYFHPLDEYIIKEVKYTIPKQINLDKTTIKTESYDALYDGRRFNMEILFPSTLLYLIKKIDEFGIYESYERYVDNIIPEFHKRFVNKINQILSNDIKYEFYGYYDFANLRYAPFEKIDEIWDIIEEWSFEADKLGNELKIKMLDEDKPKDQ